MKNVLITGSSSGIGKKTAEVLKSKGYNVFTTGRKEICEDNYLKISLTDYDSVKKLYNVSSKALSGIDILINNAGEYLCCPVEKLLPENIERIMFLNLAAPLYLASLCTPSMKQKGFGRIVNIASISGCVGEAYASLYAATKSGLYGMTKSLALELAQDNITVNCISPGWVDTNLIKDADKVEIIDVVPQRRFIEPVEIAELICYLISDKAKGLTGQNINLCAGMSVGS